MVRITPSRRRAYKMLEREALFGKSRTGQPNDSRMCLVGRSFGTCYFFSRALTGIRLNLNVLGFSLGFNRHGYVITLDFLES